MKNTNSFLSSEKNAIVEDLQAVNVEIKVTKKSDEKVYQTCLFCSHFLMGHYHYQIWFYFLNQSQQRKDFNFFAVTRKLAEKKGSNLCPLLCSPITFSVTLLR